MRNGEPHKKRDFGERWRGPYYAYKRESRTKQWPPTTSSRSNAHHRKRPKHGGVNMQVEQKNKASALPNKVEVAWDLFTQTIKRRMKITTAIHSRLPATVKLCSSGNQLNPAPDLGTHTQITTDHLLSSTVCAIISVRQHRSSHRCQTTRPVELSRLRRIGRELPTHEAFIRYRLFTLTHKVVLTPSATIRAMHKKPMSQRH